MTKADGSFEFAMSNRELDADGMSTRWEYARLVAVAPGYGIAWTLAAGAEKSGRIELFREFLEANPWVGGVLEESNNQRCLDRVRLGRVGVAGVGVADVGT